MVMGKLVSRFWHEAVTILGEAYPNEVEPPSFGQVRLGQCRHILELVACPKAAGTRKSRPKSSPSPAFAVHRHLLAN